MAGRRQPRVPPKRWTRDELEADRLRSVANFRDERLLEPSEDYGEIFDRDRAGFEDLLELTVDLTQIDEQALTVLSDPILLRAFRYVAGPPISEDDLEILADTSSLARGRLRTDPELVRRVVSTVMQGVDHRRFPWLQENREAEEAERQAAILSSSALAAMRGLEARRRNQARDSQQELVRQELLRIGLDEVASRAVPTLAQAPKPGQFCEESNLAGRKADFIVGLWDHRVMPIECKVSNSTVNSVKRLNREASAKAEAWINDLGAVQVTPVAIISGSFSLDNLEDAQVRGLTLFWAHRLHDLGDWIGLTAPTSGRVPNP